MWMDRGGVWTDGGVWVFSVWKVECVSVCVHNGVCVCVYVEREAMVEMCVCV